jgi:hypothetical protein
MEVKKKFGFASCAEGRRWHHVLVTATDVGGERLDNHTVIGLGGLEQQKHKI